MLTTEQLARYHRDGYTLFPGFLSHEEVEASSLPRRTLILSYRAADALPIYVGQVTVEAEALVRGQHLNVARFSVTEFPIPKQQHKTASLYELQELSRQQASSTIGRSWDPAE